MAGSVDSFVSSLLPPSLLPEGRSCQGAVLIDNHGTGRLGREIEAP